MSTFVGYRLYLNNLHVLFVMHNVSTLNTERWTGLSLFLVPSLTARMMAALVWQGTAGPSSWGRIASDSSERMLRTDVLRVFGTVPSHVSFLSQEIMAYRAVCRAPWTWRLLNGRLSCCALETSSYSLQPEALESRSP